MGGPSFGGIAMADTTKRVMKVPISKETLSIVNVYKKKYGRSYQTMFEESLELNSHIWLRRLLCDYRPMELAAKLVLCSLQNVPKNIEKYLETIALLVEPNITLKLAQDNPRETLKKILDLHNDPEIRTKLAGKDCPEELLLQFVVKLLSAHEHIYTMLMEADARLEEETEEKAEDTDAQEEEVSETSATDEDAINSRKDLLKLLEDSPW